MKIDPWPFSLLNSQYFCYAIMIGTRALLSNSTSVCRERIKSGVEGTNADKLNFVATSSHRDNNHC